MNALPSDRRALLKFAAAALIRPGSTFAADDAKTASPPDEAKERLAVFDRAKLAKLGTFRLVRVPHFQVMGNVDESYLKLVSRDCEDVYADFVRHFTAKRWTPIDPERRLTVVVLANEIDYARFLGEKTATLASGGRYDLKSNRLIVFDYRPAESRVAAGVGWLNLTTLAHEVTHLLCYNMGVLNRDGDCPRSVAEGLATYAEERPPNSRSSMGRLNDNRLDDLANIRRQAPWLPIKNLLVSDDALMGRRGGLNLLLAYAESWLFVYYWMSRPESAERLRDYLKTIHPRRDAKNRLADAERYFGDLKALDARLIAFSVQLLKSR